MRCGLSEEREEGQIGNELEVKSLAMALMGQVGEQEGGVRVLGQPAGPQMEPSSRAGLGRTP